MSPTVPSESPPAGQPVTPAAADDDAFVPDRHALRRFLNVWLTVAVIEAVLYLLLYRSPELKGLYKLPAVAVLVAGMIQGWHSRRRRLGHDRRRADRRNGAG
jgi:hypothetical protein